MVLIKDPYDAECGLTQSLLNKSFVWHVLAWVSFLLELQDHSILSFSLFLGVPISDLQEAQEKRGRLDLLLKQRV